MVGGLRKLTASFVVPGPCGVAVRDRLKHLTPQDERVLRAVGARQGTLASGDLKVRCADGLEHGADTWAARKRGLTALSSSRIAGAITKATHDQWALARRCQAAYIQNLAAGIRTLRHRLSLPVGEKGTKRAAGGYRSKGEWFRKSRRLAALEDRHAAAVADWQAGRVRARLVSMAAEHGLSIVAVDPAYTSLWGAQHWQKPLTTRHRKMSRHDAAGIAIGRRALGHPIRDGVSPARTELRARGRTAPPPHDQSDRAGHRTAQAASRDRGREGTRPPTTDRTPGGPSPSGKRKRGTSASNTVRDAPSTHQWVQDPLTHTG